MIRKRLSTIIIIILTILGGLASILKQFYPLLGIILIILGIILAIRRIILTEIQTDAFKKMLEAQNTILASKKLGNVYQQMVESEFESTGRSREGIAHLKKAYQLESDNIEVIKYLVMFLALDIAWRSSAAGGSLKYFQNDWTYAKKLAEEGLKINRKEYVLMDSLGVLYDVAGKHEVARRWFSRSSRLRSDPFWHLLMSASWGMSGENTKSAHEVEIAIDEGAGGWPVELYYGVALTWSGRCEEALYHLNEARRLRGIHPQLSLHRMHARLILSRFSLSSVIDALYLVTFLLSFEPWRHSKQIARVSALLLVGITGAISRAVWTLTSKVPSLMKIHQRLYAPFAIAFDLAYKNAEAGDIESACRFFEICYSMSPQTMPVLINLSGCYAVLGNRAKAVELIDEALRKEPHNELLLWNKKQIELRKRLNVRFDIHAKTFLHE